jgi:hypothetical protein
MKRNLFATLGGLVALGLIGGCASDPTASLRGGVETVIISRSHVEFDQGSKLELEAWYRDAQGNVLAILPEIATSDASVVSVTVDTLISGDPLLRTRFTIEAEGAGSAAITATAGGITSDTTMVISFPLLLPSGTISNNQNGYMDILTLTAPAGVLQFTDSSIVTINGGSTYLRARGPTEIQAQSLSQLALTDATVTVTNLLFLGTSLITELDAEETVSVRGEPNEPGNDTPAEAPTITPPTTFVGSVGDGGFDGTDLFFFNLANTADVTVTVGFPEHTDIDLAIYDDQDNEIEHSWYSNPEQLELTLAAGTYYIEVYLYATDDPTPIWYDFSFTSP